MDFRFDEDDRRVVEQAGATFRARIDPWRLLGEESTAVAWSAVAADGWLDIGQNVGADDAVPLYLVAGVAREAGRVLAGDVVVTNAVVLANVSADVPLAPGFLVADGRKGLLATSSTTEAVPWCYGVEPGLEGYRVDTDGTVHRAGRWDFRPVEPLAVAAGTVDAQGWEPVGRIARGDALMVAARTVHAASLVGLAEAVSAQAVEYAGQRSQFGGPIGRFQAVKHMLADVATMNEIAWNAVLYAALRPGRAEVDVACLQAKRAADLATRTSLQTFGGIAMTWEHPLHLYLKTARTSCRRFGSVDDHAARLGADLLEGA